MVWCADYVKNSQKIPADTLDFEKSLFQSHRCFEDFFPLFFPFLAHQWRWKAISNFRLCKKWNMTLTVDFQGQGYLSDFFSIFFVFSPSNYVGKHSEILVSTRNEIWPRNTDFKGQQCLEEFRNYFLRIQNIKFCLKTLNILCLLRGRFIDHPCS